MNKFSAGTVGSRADRGPRRTAVVVLCHEHRTVSATDCTVMCAGSDAAKHDDETPELKPEHLDGIAFGDPTYPMPYALYTIPPR